VHVRDLPHYDPDNPVTASPDEEAFGLIEVDLWTEDSENRRVVHRFQVVDFRRGSKRMRQVRDLNKEKVVSILDDLPPMDIVCAIEDEKGQVHFDHKVGEVMEMADVARDRKKARDTIAAMRQASTLIPDAIERAEQLQKLRAAQSHFGPLSVGKTSGTQRNR
jgi:hypothetical protein